MIISPLIKRFLIALAIISVIVIVYMFTDVKTLIITLLGGTVVGARTVFSGKQEKLATLEKNIEDQIKEIDAKREELKESDKKLTDDEMVDYWKKQ